MNNIEFINNADEEIKALDSLNTKLTVVIDKEFERELQNFEFRKDTIANIELLSYKANELIYQSNTVTDQLAVFSEMYYKNGWNAYVDGNLTPHFRADYVLRAMIIPKGKHKIEFKFEPEVIQTGNTFTLISYALLVLVPLGWYFKDKKKNGKTSSKKI